MSTTDMRALGRLGLAQGGGRPPRRRRIAARSVRGVPATTRRPRLPRPIGLLAAGLFVVLAYVGVSAASQTGSDSTIATLPAVPAPQELVDPMTEPRRSVGAERADRASRDDGPPSALDPDASTDARAFATVEGLEIGLPHDDVALIAFHEASLREALAMTPVGRLEANDNPTKFAGGQEQTDGLGYRVLSSRGRPRPATSAVDIVVPVGATVTAPVTGTVVEVRDYALYGSTRDWRVVIEPTERPDLHVVMIHLHRPAVAVGDTVEAGSTPIAVARELSFSSQVDYVTDEALPHVHLEVKPATNPKPVDPNATAAERDDTVDVERSS